MPLITIHTPTDILAERAVEQKLAEKLGGNPQATLQDVLEALGEMPEYQKTLAKPVIRVGSPKDYAGKTVVIMAGGTNGGVDVIKAVKEQNIGNCIVAGHMASDSIGINIFLAATGKRHRGHTHEWRSRPKLELQRLLCFRRK